MAPSSTRKALNNQSAVSFGLMAFLLNYGVIVRYIVVAILIFLASCERGADLENVKEYSKSGIFFKYPGNWEFVEDYESDNVRFIFIESPGDGIMKIEIYNYEDSFDLKEFVRLDIEALLGVFPKVLGVERPDLIMNTEKTIGNQKLAGLMYEVDISILGMEVPHIIEVYEISNDKKAAYLSGQVAIEDSHLVSSGFDLIFSSFRHKKITTNNPGETQKDTTPN